MKILILRIILRKLQHSKKNSENWKILRTRMLVNTSPGAHPSNKNRLFTNILCNYNFISPRKMFLNTVSNNYNCTFFIRMSVVQIWKFTQHSNNSCCNYTGPTVVDIMSILQQTSSYFLNWSMENGDFSILGILN